MYVEGIMFKKEEKSGWEKGVIIGKSCSSDSRIFLDAEYKPIDNVWDFVYDCERGVCISIRED